jgi:transcription-repair coupling factor (superfamily II helicase)
MILPVVAELLSRIARHSAVETCVDRLRRAAAAAAPIQEREVRLAGLTATARILVAAQAIVALDRPVLYLVDSPQRAEAVLEPLRYFVAAGGGRQNVALLPACDVLPYQSRSPHADIAEARGVALWRYVSGDATVLVAPFAAAAQKLREAEYYRALACPLERGRDVAFDGLLAHLAAAGYERQDLVELPGQFSLRGGILDLFSPETARPVRIEFFGDTVESLREFDPATQRSTQPLERTTVLPLTDTLRTATLLQRVYAGVSGEQEGRTLDHAGPFAGWEFYAAALDPLTSTLFDLQPRAVVFSEEPDLIAEAAQKLAQRLRSAAEEAGVPSALAGSARLRLGGPDDYFLPSAGWDEALAARPLLLLESLPVERPGRSLLQLPSQPTTRYPGNVPVFMAEALGRIREGQQVLIASATIGEVERFADLCHEFEIPYRLGEVEETVTMARLAADATAGSVPAATLLRVPLGEGVVFPGLGLVLHGNSDLFEAVPGPARGKRKPRAAAFFNDFAELKPGDFVVHVDHGIGRFDGLRQLETDGAAAAEFMLLTFAEDAKLYVPLARLDLIQKYRSLEGSPPPLDRLGGNAWVARKARVRKSVAEMAEKLLALYADRKTVAGHPFAVDSQWQAEFEDAFEYEETPDQARAIAEVKRDMEKPLPMDRLLCGDVGYGKTEVAMRAAFKALADARQVAVLAPTTVLAFQHFQTFRRRMAAFPVRIDMLSRFRSDAEQKKTIGDLEAGKVDVVIGTHRLLSRDVRFPDLGLLIVDEEQRFGVAHKERIKEMRKNVDVLTMSATPIPRTLHMSLVGLRDMSVIETPPKDRLAIQTVVAPFTEALLKSAIQEELGRGGQVYFVHNRVASIYTLASLLQRLVPQARVVVGHGQMAERQLEQVMMNFVRGDADILVSTTIIENGLDIPRCNTIFINRADRLGLSELYQLRGRVGRSDRRAYAYLLVPPDANLSALARRRLAALKEFSDLGAGFRIAALDLELRGAGNLLGGQQHGHINAIGFDMYCQMLERAVAERKGELQAPELRTTLNLGLDIRIPPQYIESENLRLRIYKRISSVATAPEREEALREIADRFGPPPPAIGNLLDYALLKAECERLLVASVERRSNHMALKFHEATRVTPQQLVRVVRAGEGLKLDPSGVLWIPWTRAQGSVCETVRAVLLQLQA